MPVGVALLALSCGTCAPLGVLADAEGPEPSDALLNTLLVTMFVLAGAGWVLLAWGWTGRRGRRGTTLREAEPESPDP
jgi:hypothetical protein